MLLEKDKDTDNPITLSACPNIGDHPLNPCHALMWNLWLSPVNEAYWEPVGRYLAALPRFRWASLGQLTTLSASPHPVPPPQGQDQYSWPNIHIYDHACPLSDNHTDSITTPITHTDTACTLFGLQRDFLEPLSNLQAFPKHTHTHISCGHTLFTPTISSQIWVFRPLTAFFPYK